jgi:hypothetical protein
MKARYGIFLLALMAGFLLWPSLQAIAQDTLTVNWSDAGGNIVINALRTAVLGDTLANGSRANLNRVYKLKKGGYYPITDRIENGTKGGWPLRLVGEAPDAGNNPAVLQQYRRADNSTDGRIITGQHDVTLKNLWITGADDLGTQTSYQPLQVDASNHRFIIDNCIFDRSNFAIMAYTATGNEISYTNCKFRNLIGRPSTQQWEGRGISVWADQDTVIIENCTFFNVEFTAFQMESGAAKYVRFNHNTLVNIGRNFLTGAWWREAYFANNLLINPFWQGEGIADYTASGRDPRAYNSGMFSIGPLPASYGVEKGRRILFTNTASWSDAHFKNGAGNYYGDTIRAQYYVNAVTIQDHLNAVATIKIQDTLWLGARPNMPTYPDTLVPKMWANINDLRRGITPASPYFYALPVVLGSECFTCVTWPLPENFSYTTPANILTEGTDHLPLGDLNWFPTQKAQFEANKAKYIDTLQRMAGPIETITPVGTYEAETGTLSGTSSMYTFQGFSWFVMQGGGSMTWAFTMPSAVDTTNLKIVVNTRSGSSERGENLFINGTAIVNWPSNWGEYHWWFNPLNTWLATPITKDSVGPNNGRPAFKLRAGLDTIKITSSWGYQDFAGFDIYSGATKVLSLTAADAIDYTIVAPNGSGAPWVPSKFKSVKLGANGTITWNITAPTTSTYAVNIAYQNFGGPQTVQLKVDGATVVAGGVPLTSKADSTGLTTLSSPPFAMTAGAHTLALTGATANIDFVQVNTDVINGISGRDGLPQAFALAQNYPNPFNPSTRIDFNLGKASDVKLTVYNVLGQRVATLVNGHLSAGQHTVQFDARNIASGVYFYRLDAGSFVSSKKMMLLK